MPETIGDYQFSKRDLIGHGAFAIVFLGHSKSVRIQDTFVRLVAFDYFGRRIPINKWPLNK